VFTDCRSSPTVCVTCVWAGVDTAWERGKLEAWKMLENAAESHPSAARFVSPAMIERDLTGLASHRVAQIRLLVLLTYQPS
jgi:hypothetical protein